MIIPVIIGATGNYERFKEKFVNHTRKTLNKLTKKDNYLYSNTTHSTESTAV
jgi:menaquinone-dependent protoporphyrinogen IX oxidase